MNVSILRRFVLALCLAAATSFTVHAAPNEKPTVHVIAIGDLDVGGKFGKKVAEDARNIVATFKDCFAKAGKAGQLNPILLEGTDVTPDNVLDVIDRLNVRASDTIVVLYSGHGMMRPGNQHLLTFHHGHLERTRLLAALKAKSPRLTVVLTDCCSGGIEERPVVPTYAAKAMKAGVRMEWDTMASLFLQHGGVVDITAAEPGYNGKIDLDKAGSLFTNALVRVLKTPHAELIKNLDRDGDRHLQWDEILPQLRGVAAEYDRVQMEKYTNEHGIRPQQAFAISLGRWIPTVSNAR